jgi:aspartate aminotransferase
MIPAQLRHTRPSATLLINEHCQKLIREGKKVYRLGFGQSPFPVPEFLVNALCKNAHRGEYSPVVGIHDLRQKIAEHYSKRDNRVITANDVMIGPGSKELLYLIQLACQDSNSFFPSPAWVSYPAHMNMLEKDGKIVPTSYMDSWKLTTRNVKPVLKDKTGLSMLILNTPNNPTGLVYSEQELANLAKLFEENNTTVIADEIYEHMQFDNEFCSIAKVLPSQTIISSGFSKSMGCGGWRIGYAIFPPEMADVRRAVTALASETFSCPASPTQYAMLEVFNPDNADVMQDYLLKSRKILQAIGLWSANFLNECNIDTHTPQGGFYIFPDFNKFAHLFRRNNINNSEEMCQAMLDATGVGLLPGNEFSTLGGYQARVCYIDFDGKAAMENVPDSGEIDEEWLRENCKNVVEGVERIGDWVTSMR